LLEKLLHDLVATLGLTLNLHRMGQLDREGAPAQEPGGLRTLPHVVFLT
jgi:hypothetical protein